MSKRPLVIDLALAGSLNEFLREIASPVFDQAACLGASPELFFDESPSAVKLAKMICAECPVKNQCAEWASRVNEYGVFGGMTPNERKSKFGAQFAVASLNQTEVAEELGFILSKSAAEVSWRYRVDKRTVVRWRGILRNVKDVA
jgi:hypothetical protein